MSYRNKVAAEVLDAWASAIRGDWGSIDGRTCRDELNRVSAFLRGERPSLMMADVGVCMAGEYGAHWQGMAGEHHAVACWDLDMTLIPGGES